MSDESASCPRCGKEVGQIAKALGVPPAGLIDQHLAVHERDDLLHELGRIRTRMFRISQQVGVADNAPGLLNARSSLEEIEEEVRKPTKECWNRFAGKIIDAIIAIKDSQDGGDMPKNNYLGCVVFPNDEQVELWRFPYGGIVGIDASYLDQGDGRALDPYRQTATAYQMPEVDAETRPILKFPEVALGDVHPVCYACEKPGVAYVPERFKDASGKVTVEWNVMCSHHVDRRNESYPGSPPPTYLLAKEIDRG